MKKYALIFFCCLFLINLGPLPRYKNPALPVEERVADLLIRMTLEEKVSQIAPFMIRDTSAFDKQGNFISTMDTALLNRGVGSLSARHLFREGSNQRRAKMMNSLQKYMMEKTRLGIPVFIFNEALHGLMAAGATSFPQAIALGSTWDTTLVEQVFTVAALEGRARGTRQVLSPVLDLARDPRWGRTEECYSEDPYLVSRIGMAAVYGLQGRTKMLDQNHVVVTLKHFAGHGQPEGGRNLAPVNYSERIFRENHLYPFEMAIRRAGALSVMASYNEWDGIPNHVNHKLLTDILRGEWGFKGYVMSDGGGMDLTYTHHRAAANPAESGALSIQAGLDYDLGSWGRCFGSLVEQVRQGTVSEESINRAAGSVLRVKFTCGLFEYPYIEVDQYDKITNSKEHEALALKAAHEAMVLLKNENNVLPFDATKIKTLAVIGPNAADIHLGGYSAVPMAGVSILEGMLDFAAGKFDVVYAEGCKLTLNEHCDWQVNENPVLSNPETDRKLITEAVRIANISDAVVLVLGENELICREAWSEKHLGDRDDLNLVGSQNDLAAAILQTGKPVAILLINGRPITINYLQQKAPAILECWYLGQETGHAVTDVIFGKINPSGKLPVTFPRSVGQLPCFYNKKPTNHRHYVLADSTPLYPFGFGLSYTTYEYKNLKLNPQEIPADGTCSVSIDITNSGKMSGDEIAQLYIHDVVSLPTRPVQELKDFTRISLKPGETRTVTFSLTPDKLEAFNMNMNRVVQPGAFEIMVGKNSQEFLKDTLMVKNN